MDELQIDVATADTNLTLLETEAGKLAEIVSSISTMMTTLSTTYEGESSTIIEGAVADFNTNIGTIETSIKGVRSKIDKYIREVEKADKSASLSVDNGQSGDQSNG